MNISELKTDLVHVGVTESCGHLFPVRFRINNTFIEPLNVAPWFNEVHDDSLPPMLKMLRGDFFCAPFGDSDMIPEEHRPHGATSNDLWKVISKDQLNVSMLLTKKVMGAEVTKNIKLIHDHPIIYQEHIFNGGNGKIPLGHHLMLKAPGKLYLSFSDYLFGETPPAPVETDPAKGNSILKYPQRFNDLKKVKLSDGTEEDLTSYPALTAHEDLLMLKSNESLPFAWSAAAAPQSGWLWFSIKNPVKLNSTVLWFSNGGRKYFPFSGRHTGVIGIEEVTSFFHLGHKASVTKNYLNSEGYSTALLLQPGNTLTIRYAFGMAPVPEDFTYVKKIIPAENGISIEDSSGIKIKIKFDLNFITEKQENR